MDIYDYSSYSYTTGATYSEPMTAATIMLIMFIYFLIIAVIYVVYALLLGQIFKKAGEPRWAAWVPFYNNWKMLEMGNQQGFWAVLAIIPFVNIASAVFMYIAMYHIGLKFGKSGAFLLFGIFLPLVWYIILAVDSSKWQDNQVAAAPTTPAPTV